MAVKSGEAYRTLALTVTVHSSRKVAGYRREVKCTMRAFDEIAINPSSMSDSE